MAHSRLEKIGTIYTRITGLIRAGAMKLDDRPLWYEVYQAFPPLLPPRFDRPVPDIPIREIFYPEDVIRAKFHKKLGSRTPSVNLADTRHPTMVQKVIALTKKLQEEEGMDMDSAFNTAYETIRTDKIEESQSLVKNYTDAVNKKSKIKISKPDLKEMFD